MSHTAANTGRQSAKRSVQATASSSGGGSCLIHLKTLTNDGGSDWTSPKEEAMYKQDETRTRKQGWGRKMRSTLYFAYGSNLDPTQMRRRCPGARAVGPAVLDGYRIGFAGQSQLWDGGGVATLLRDPGEWVEGILYELPKIDLEILDRYEGHPVAYRRRLLLVEDEHGARRKAQVYLKDAGLEAPPSKDYLGVIRRAYHRLGFDDTPLLQAMGGAR